MDAALSDEKIMVLLYNGQVTSPATDAVKQLAQKSDVPVFGMTETLPPSDKDFQQCLSQAIPHNSVDGRRFEPHGRPQPRPRPDANGTRA
jgi:hypothetical protein